MKERPLLFSGPMVRAILEGRKTQTRRVVKPEHLRGSQPVSDALDMLGPQLRANAARYCPQGQPGDLLWVKETHRFDGLDPRIALRSQLLDDISYRADMEGDRACDDCVWRPSIFMPRWASRITLEIVSVRVERLNDISEQDAKAEGVSECMTCGYLDNGTSDCSLRCKYKALWESINGDGSWIQNPWVWVIEFKRL